VIFLSSRIFQIKNKSKAETEAGRKARAATAEEGTRTYATSETEGDERD